MRPRSSGALAGVVKFTTKDASDFLKGDDRFAVRLKGGYESNSEGLTGSVILAGKPADGETEMRWRTAGIDLFVHVGIDVAATLKGLLVRAGVAA